jgi:hypothetical protein
VHTVEEGKINMFNGHFGLQVTAELLCYLPGYPVLAKGGLYKYISSYYQE